MTTNNFTCINNYSLNGSALQHTFGYIREFCQHAEIYQQNKTDDSLLRLNRSISLLTTTTQPHHFAPGCLVTSKFFIDLYAIMSTVDSESDTLWSCITLLQHCSRNLEARQAVINDYCFVSLLGFLVTRIQRQDRIYRLLVLLQELTYGICITWEDPHLIGLIEYLIEIVNTQDNGDDQSQARLALSILVNLCYKNFCTTFFFLRSVNVSTFSRRIQNYGLLANKMLIILSEDMHPFKEEELHVFLRTALASLDESINAWNVPHFKHIVEFIMDSQSHQGFHTAMLSYTHYREDIERLLNKLDEFNAVEDLNEENRQHQQICLSVFVKLVVYILELSRTTRTDGEENVISMDSINLRLFEFAASWIESDICGVEAIRLLDTLLHLAKRDQIVQQITRDPAIIIQLVSITEKPLTKATHTAAILQLLLTLLQQSKLEKLILSKISESYFDKILTPLLAIKPEFMNKHTIRQDETEKSISCLHLLISFAEIAKKAYLDKCVTLLRQEPLQYALARAMLCGDERLCSIVFKIFQFQHFPRQQVVKHLAELNIGHSSDEVSKPNHGIHDQRQSLSIILKNYRTFVSKDVEQRLHALIKVISTAQRNNNLQSIPTSQIIELCNYRIEAFNSNERSMKKCLEDASAQITHYSQRLSLQNAELEKYHALNFELHVNQERLQTQSKDLKEQKDKLKAVMTDLLKRLAEQTEKLQINEKNLASKSSEVILLEKQNKELKSQLKFTTAQFEKFETLSKESNVRIEKLKKTINAYEHDIKDKLLMLDERDRELTKTQKLLEEHKEARKKSDDLISAMEVELQEKKEEIKGYELELSETEELRKTIMSLMESKKPKRKA